MPAKDPICVLPEEDRKFLTGILDALIEETDEIEIEGESINLIELQERINSCSTEMPTVKKGKKKRGPKEPSAYNKFIGECRRSPEKGGRGLDFKTCVAEWNEKKAAGEV